MNVSEVNPKIIYDTLDELDLHCILWSKKLCKFFLLKQWSLNVVSNVCTFIWYVCVYVCMDGWMDGWMDGCINSIN